MTTTRSTKRPSRSISLTMKGHAFVWREVELETLAARPADATAPCELCGDTFAAKGLKALDHDYTYTRASEAEEGPANRDAQICAHCRRDLEAKFGTHDTQAVYHILDRGMYGYSD